MTAGKDGKLVPVTTKKHVDRLRANGIRKVNGGSMALPGQKQQGKP